MSAYLCDTRTFDLLATAASDHLIMATAQKARPGAEPYTIEMARRAVAELLAAYNVRSIQYRYGQDDLEGNERYTRFGKIPGDWTYTPTKHGAPQGHGRGRSHSTIKRVLGAARCYNYQSCELPEWDQTVAWWFLQHLTGELAFELSTGWEYTAEMDRAPYFDSEGDPAEIETVVIHA